MNMKIMLSLATGIATVTSYGAYAQEEEFEVESDKIVVTASPLERTVGETILNTSVISDEELQRRLENSIGETLRREPGVSSTFFGPGASRPVIRGLGGDRIRVLDAGIGSIDASATSPDHAVSVEPATAEKIEIVRGSGTLLYGSSAAGGVVNVFNGRIPTERPEDGIDGAVRAGGSTVDDGVELAGGVDLELGEVGGGAIVLHADGAYRDAEDYDIPGFAESAVLRAAEEAEGEEEGEEEEEEIFGTAENTFFETEGGSVGLSWIFGNGFFGISGTVMDTTYGVPGGHGHEEGEEEDEEEEEEGGVTIDLEQRRLDLAGEVNGQFGLFQTAKIRFGYADYEHAEIEPSGEVGTLFSNEGWEGRFELIDKPMNAFGGELNGAVGLQYRKRDFSAIGEEAFVPPTDTSQLGIFALKELTTGPWRFEVGGRFEHTSHEVSGTTVERNFDGFSVSGGAGVNASENVFLGVTAFRTERAPSTEELFSNGPHLATNAFEIGDPTLNEEVAKGIEGTVRFRTERFSASINGFYTSYDDFIFEAATGEEEDELPVFQFFAEDAKFRGFEAQVDAELFRVAAFDVHGDASFDYVRATTDATGNDNLPRIPPFSGLVGLEARSSLIDVRGELEFAGEQDDVTDFELPTDDYQVFNVFVTIRPIPDAENVSFRLSMNNLTDEDVRLHTIFLEGSRTVAGPEFQILAQRDVLKTISAWRLARRADIRRKRTGADRRARLAGRRRGLWWLNLTLPIRRCWRAPSRRWWRALGVVVVALNAAWATRRHDEVVSFASGMLVATAILHLIPEGLETTADGAIYVLGGFVVLWIGDRLFAAPANPSDGARPQAALIPAVGIAFHSFVDGLEYPFLFAHDLFTGLLATAGLIIHEFAEGAIVFAILRAAGAKTLAAVAGALVVAAATTPFGAYVARSAIDPMGEEAIGRFLALAAGALLYVGAAHLPRHLRQTGRLSNVLLFVSAVVIAGALSLTHDIGGGHHH